ncbi:MAG: hypothetical protein Q8M15_08920 [Bacteroidota bacterium]|nr:hypothetical protein [Bacteroidota bacterium]
MNTWSEFGNVAYRMQEVAAEWKFTTCIPYDKLQSTQRVRQCLYALIEGNRYKLCLGLALGMRGELERAPIYRVSLSIKKFFESLNNFNYFRLIPV